jgi:glycolate oxidase FAD binding subunit
VRGATEALTDLADAVGGVDDGPVVAVGGRTQFDVGGPVSPAAREVRAPRGIVQHDPAEMTVRVAAGTTVASLDEALRRHGQCVALPAAPGATVGGVLAVGRSDIRRLGWGPVRDTVLELSVVLPDGHLVKAGGPTVKNVTGYDLCRLFVGSLGTLAVLGEAVLRTRPVPRWEQWFRAPRPVAAAELHGPAALLWDGETTFVLLDGHPDDVKASASAIGLRPSDPPDLSPYPHRWSIAAAAVPGLVDDGHGPFLAEVGVGIVHRTVPQPARPVDPGVRVLHQRLKARFDPTGRLAPGREVLAS